MDGIRITVAGEPTAQGRPKFSNVNGFPMAYEPAKSRDWKKYASLAAAEKMKGRPPMEGPLTMQIHVFRAIPVSWSRKKRIEAAQGIVRPTGRPDVDNYVKSAMDALKGIVWADDSQVVSLMACKHYSETPRLEMCVRRIEVAEEAIDANIV